MKDFSAKVKAAEREAQAKRKSPENTRRKAPKTAIKKGQHLSPATEWKPGISPNPGGRPCKTPVTDALRRLLAELHPDQKRHKGKTRADVIAEQMLAQSESSDLPTQKEVIDRVEGKVPQKSEHGGPDGGAIPFISLTREENERRLRELQERAATIQ